MSEKEQVVIEVIRNEGPLAPAPSAATAEADLDAILRALRPGEAQAQSASAPNRAVITLELGDSMELGDSKERGDSMELGNELQPPSSDVTDPILDPSLAFVGDLLDLGLEEEATQADAKPMLNEELTLDDASARIAEELTLDDASARIAETLSLMDLPETPPGLGVEAAAPLPIREQQLELESNTIRAAPIPVRELQPESEAAAPIPVRELQPESEAAAPMPVRELELAAKSEAAAPMPVREPESEPGGVAPVVAAPSTDYAGDGSVVEVESEAQREAREEQEARRAARELAERNEEAENLAKAEAEARAIKAARAEMDAKKQKRKEARLARKQQNEDEDEDTDTPERVALHKNVQERVRNLSAAEQQKLARTGEQRERVVLERLLGKTVWEALLRNPKLTPPEASRIARMGALPVPLLEIIVSNRSWLSSPQVRRALFTNPRLKKEMLMTVLRATPKAELKLMPKQTAYPHAVRQAAKRLLR